MALNPNYEAIGKAFVTQYYQVTCELKEYWFKSVDEQGLCQWWFVYICNKPGKAIGAKLLLGG